MAEATFRCQQRILSEKMAPFNFCNGLSEYDLARAISRAALLQKATGVKTMPVILGKTISEPLRQRADAMQAGWVLLPD